MIIQNRQSAGSFFVHACAEEIFPDFQKKTKVSMVPAYAIFTTVLIFFIAFHADSIVQVMPKPLGQIVVQWASSNFSNFHHAAVGATHAPASFEIIKKFPAPVKAQMNELAKADFFVHKPILDETTGFEPNLLGFVKIPVV